MKSYAEQKVWLTAVEDFNDPFESKHLFQALSPRTVLENRGLFDMTLQYCKINGEPDLTAEELTARLESSQFEKDARSPILRDFLSHGVLCLTIRNDSIPMWAYYANDHKGYCLEFEVDFSFIKNKLALSDEQIEDWMAGVKTGKDILSFSLEEFEFVFTKVKYGDTLPTFDFDQLYKTGDSKDVSAQYNIKRYITHNSVGVKFKDWAHEDEFRLISAADSKKYGALDIENNYGFLKITGIIMGSKIEKPKENLIRELALTRGLDLYKASIKQVVLNPLMK